MPPRTQHEIGGESSDEEEGRRAKKAAAASLYTLRHTHGSHLLAADVPLTDVSKRLGHTNPHVTALRSFRSAAERGFREIQVGTPGSRIHHFAA